MALEDFISGLGGIGSGALMGAPLGPFGALAGGAIGGLGSLFGMGERRKAKKSARKQAKHSLNAAQFALDEAIRNKEAGGESLERQGRGLEESFASRGLPESSISSQGMGAFGRHRQRLLESLSGRENLARSALDIIRSNYRRMRKGKGLAQVGQALGNLFGAGAGIYDQLKGNPLQAGTSGFGAPQGMPYNPFGSMF